MIRKILIRFFSVLTIGSTAIVHAQWTTGGTTTYLTTTSNTVGIGTTTTTYKLQVVGTIRSSSGNGYVDLSPGPVSSVEIGSHASTSAYCDFKGSANLGADFRGRIIYTEGYGFGFQTAGNTTNRLVINENGYVGVGTSPVFPYSFQVEGVATKFSTGLSSTVFSPGVGIEFANGYGTNSIFDFKGSSNLSADYRGRIKHDDNSGFSFYTAAHTIPDMTLDNSGKVTIGNVSSTSNDFKLFVQKGIVTERVKVALSTGGDWPDYVFEPGYKLMPLDHLRQYLEENKHLPDVPSAEEICLDGIDLGDMDARLLRKIEELTLYTLQLNEQNKRLVEELEALKLKIQSITVHEPQK